MKAFLNASEGEIILVTITGHPPHITHYLRGKALLDLDYHCNFVPDLAHLESVL